MILYIFKCEITYFITLSHTNYSDLYFIYLDVMGQVKDVGDLDSVQCQGKPKKKIEFVLGDIQ